MEIKPGKSRLRVGNDPLGKLYPHNLQFYTNPPTETISLQEFEEFAVERVKVLKAVESLGIRHVKGSTDYKGAFDKELASLRKQGILKILGCSSSSVEENSDTHKERRKDHISHFILRLAYCKSDDLRRWFITQELELFKHRYIQEQRTSLQAFLSLNNLSYKPIAESEKVKLLPKLIAAGFNLSGHQVESKDYYKVPFTDVLELVRSRRVYLEGGFAYVPQDELVVIILSVFRAHLSHALAVTARAVPAMEEDDRLLKLLKNIHHVYLGNNYTTSNKKQDAITADMIYGLSKQSFPPCMQNLHSNLIQNHHLKHSGRMQYGLFLKGIGLSLDEAMRFWRTEFTKNPAITVDKFDKQYSYNIRHNYGKEGKRANYTPYSCIKIITSNPPGPGDNHGCPFRHTDADLLRQRLQSLHIHREGQDKIMELVKGSHYQLACREYFKVVHKTKEEFDLSHPNQYFEESQKVIHGESSEKVESNSAARGTPKTVKIVKKTQSDPMDEFSDVPLTEQDMDMALASCYMDTS